jgi:hypothetical protein
VMSLIFLSSPFFSPLLMKIKWIRGLIYSVVGLLLLVVVGVH